MPILTETFEGSPEGMNVSLPAQELPDTQARYMQDILIDYPGLIRRRGPVRKVAGSVEFTNKVSGIVQTLDPQGSNRIAVLHGDTSTGLFGFLSNLFDTKVDLEISKDSDIDLPASPPTNPYRLIDSKQARGGGALIGISDTYNTTTNQALVLWRGARKADYATGTITVGNNSKTVTGSGTTWSTNVEPGMFLFLDGTPKQYVGTVKSVDSNTQLTLENAALQAGSAVAYSLQSRRGIVPRVMKGRITCTTTSTTVTGAGTKFIDQKVKNPSGDTWLLYRLSDGFYIGTISSVQSNTSLTLSSNAALALSNERFFAVNALQHYGVKTNLSSTNGAYAKVGFLNAVYAERQWYANLGQDMENTARVWFSDPLDLEGLDLSPTDGDFIQVGTARGSSAPIRGMAAAYNALVIAKEDEVYALRGSTPSTFSVTKLHDDGTLCGMSMQGYSGGVIWAGRNGINFYDGVQVENLTQEKLGDYYKNLIRSFDPTKYRMWSMMERDHYFLFIESTAPSVPVLKGLRSSTPTQFCICVYMPTRGITIHTNLNIRGSAKLPADTGEATWYVINGYPTTLTAVGNTAAPTGFTPKTLADDRVYATAIDIPVGWVPRIEAYIDGNGAAAVGTTKVRMGLYRNDGGDEQLVAESEPIEVPAGMAAQWKAFDFVIPSRLTGVNYWVAIHVEKDQHVRIWEKTHTGFSIADDCEFNNGLPDPLVPDGGDANRDFGFRVSYSSTSTIKGYVCDSGELFDTDDRDDYGCDSGVPGPDFYYESKKFSAGDSLRKKLFKQLAVHYMVQGGALKLDTIVGLNDQGKTSGSTFPPSNITWAVLGALYNSWDQLADAYSTWSATTFSIFKPKRIKFLKRSTHLSFRLYQASMLTQRLRLGPYQVGYKLQRPGRI